MNHTVRLTLLLAACSAWPIALSAQIGPPPRARADSSALPQRPDSARMAMFGPAPDPVGFLLENKDSLHLAPDVVQQLVAINLDLFRRNSRVQRQIDSILPPPDDAAGGTGYGGVRMGSLTPEQRDAVAPLMARRAANIERARTAAYDLLTPAQRDQAQRLETRSREQLRRGGRGRRPG